MRDRDRVLLNVSGKSVGLLQRALKAELAHLISQASGLEALGDTESLMAVRGDYHHTLNLLKKVMDGRSTVGVIEP